jgi:hypothetical protein
MGQALRRDHFQKQRRKAIGRRDQAAVALSAANARAPVMPPLSSPALLDAMEVVWQHDAAKQRRFLAARTVNATICDVLWLGGRGQHKVTKLFSPAGVLPLPIAEWL